MRVYQQAEGEEHYYLKQPGEGVHEEAHLPFKEHFAVPDNESRHVYRKVSVAPYGVCYGKGDEDHTQQHYRVESRVGEGYLVYEPYNSFSYEYAQDYCIAELFCHINCYVPSSNLARVLYYLYEYDCEHISHGVVTTALKLKKRLEVVLELHFL